MNATPHSPPHPASLTLPVEGMTCASCVARVERAILGVPGVRAASVNLLTESAEVSFEAAPHPRAVIDAIERAGYRVPAQPTPPPEPSLSAAPVELVIEGMSCASCVGRVERALASVSGVRKAEVNLVTQRATVQTEAPLNAPLEAARLVEAVAKAGYRATLVRAARQSAGDATERGNAARNEASLTEGVERRRDAEASRLQRNLIVALVLTTPLLALEMGTHLFPALHHLVVATLGANNWPLQFVLTTLVLLGPGFPFYKKGLPALARLAPDMNSLVAVGTLAAYGYSVVATFFPALLPAAATHVFYEAAAVIVTLVLLGRSLEARAKGRASRAIRRLITLQPQTALVRRQGESVALPIAEVILGDIVVVRPGERVPVDGQVVEGSSYVDESMITGEPAPVGKVPGDALTAGTINRNGSLTLRATAVGGHTVLARIIRMVEQAQGSKLPIQSAVDRVTLWFVPAVMGLSLMTFAAWLAWGPEPALPLALVNAVAVLIIACPCAMGLATPTSILVGTGRGAELGILFRKGDALQALKETRMVAFDKTGTLTEGRPVLTDVRVREGFTREDALMLAASLEDLSEHPVGRAIVEAARREGLALQPVEGFEALPGYGIRGRVGGKEVAVGADRFMVARGVDIAAALPLAQELAHEAKSPLYLAVDGRPAAVLAVSDPVKPSAAGAIRRLKAMGLRVALITGDNRATAAAVARALGIDEVMAEVLPEGKLEAVRTLKAQGVLAFVGDGINDAPALAEADVGIAVSSGTDVAIETAEVVLMAGTLDAVPTAIELSRATLRNIKENLFWAFGYNVALIPMAAGAFYAVGGLLLSPAVAAGAMGLSSVFVVGNALRLKRFRPRPSVQANDPTRALS